MVTLVCPNQDLPFPAFLYWPSKFSCKLGSGGGNSKIFYFSKSLIFWTEEYMLSQGGSPEKQNLKWRLPYKRFSRECS